MKVPLYSFATFVAGGLTAKVSAVANTKQPGSYDPATDWWKQLREALPKNHQAGGSQSDLVNFAASVTPRKRASYGDRVTAYNAWWGKQAITAGKGSSSAWKSGGVEVSVNPELFLLVGGVPHVIKLYFKQTEKLTVDRANVVLRILELAYRKGASPTGLPVVGVLDLAQGQFVVPTTSLAYLDPVLAGEAVSFATIWNVTP